MIRYLSFLLILLFGATAHAEQKPPLFEAVRKGEPLLVDQQISLGQDVNQKDEHNNTPLHYAADPDRTVSRDGIFNFFRPRTMLNPNQDYPAVAKLLIDKGADLNAKNEFGEPPPFPGNSNAP